MTSLMSPILDAGVILAVVAVVVHYGWTHNTGDVKDQGAYGSNPLMR